MSDSIIEAYGLCKRFGKVQAVQDVDLTVEKGSVVALLGPNGAGKTTTLGMITTLIKPDRGKIAIAGYDVVRQADNARAHIGVTGQSVSLDEALSGLQNLVMIGRLYHFSGRDARRRAHELIAQVDLTEAAKRPVKTYSGGMRRRLDLAASLVAQPSVLFLDEPTTGLDPQSRKGVWQTIRDLVKHGASILLTTQYLEEADQLADTILVIDHGRIIASGAPAQLKSRLGGERLDITLANASDVTKIAALRNKMLSKGVRKNTLSFAVADGTEGLKEVSAILQHIVAADVKVKEYTVQRPTLEEAFLQLVAAPKKAVPGDI